MLSLVATPIGNIEDISLRAIKALESADTIFCEDTRVTKKLIQILQQRTLLRDEIDARFIALHSHNEADVISKLDISMFEKNICFVSDAGMPCISDPGALLVDFAIKNDISYEVISGSNAALLAYASSGFSEKEFLFYGFLTHKKNSREQELQKLLQKDVNFILYESPHRIEQLAQELSTFIPKNEIFIIKEATKLHEKKARFLASNFPKYLEDINTKGEWCVIVRNSNETQMEGINEKDLIDLNLPPKTKAKLLAKVTDKTAKQWYDLLINL